MRSRPISVLAAAAAALCTLTAAARSQPAQTQATGPYTLLSAEGRRAVPVRVVDGQEMFAIEEVARLVPMTWRDDPGSGGLIVTINGEGEARGRTIVLSATQGLASSGGRLYSLPAPPAREGRSWLVPVDFAARVLPQVTGARLDVRKPSRLIVLGNLRVPRVAARHETLGSSARVTFDVAPPTPHTVAQENGRVVLRFEADALDATLPGPVGGALVTAIRRGDPQTTIVIEPGPKFGSFRASELPGDRGAGRTVIEVFAPVETTTAPRPTATEPPPLLDLPAPGGLRTVIIDPGHGGDEEGARGPNGTLEKDVTLAVGRRLKAALEARLGVRALLTRDGDRTMSLDERAALANNNKADLFISLHANASVRQAASGAEVFYLSLGEYGDEAARALHPESELLPVFGGGTRDIQLILWEMAQARYIEQSALLASLVESELRDRVPMSARAIQQAPFRVLVGANMPAVLVEMGFITNPAQEAALKSDAFQQQVVQALVNSIIRYRDTVESAPKATPASARPQGR